MKSRARRSGLLAHLPALNAGLRLVRAAPVMLPLLAACSAEEHRKQFPQTTFAPATEFARDLDWLFKYVLSLGVIVTVIVFAGLAYIVVKFRYRPGQPEPKAVHGNTRLELLWTFIPAVILASIAVPTVRQIFKWQPNEADLPANTLQVDVIGYQWWWAFRYVMPGTQDTVVTANEIHVPVGVPVQLRMTSKDVIHSFWIPQMGGKRDVIPGRTNTLFFTPEEPGVYLGQCAEFCGDSHALMKMRLVAHTPEGFQQWLRNEARPAVAPADSTLAIGKELVTRGACAGCHVLKYAAHPDSTTRGITGPNLTHFGRRYTLAGGILENNAENLTKWIANAPAVKPGSKMPQLTGDVPGALSEEQVRYIVAYLQSLQ